MSQRLDASAHALNAAASPETSFRGIHALASDQTADPKAVDAIRNDIKVVNAWFSSQTTNAAQPRWMRTANADGSTGDPIVATVHLAHTAAEYTASTNIFSLIVTDLGAVAPLEAASEKTVVWINVRTDLACGQGGISVVVLYEAACSIYPLTSDTWPHGGTYLLAHEMTHAFGAVPSCAPHYDGTSHVNDDPRDVLYNGPQQRDWDHLMLDPGHDDYYATGRTNCLDIAGSAFWTTEFAAPGPPTAVSAVVHDAEASVSFSAPRSVGMAPVTSYVVSASRGGATAAGAAGPISVSGLSYGTTYTFTVHAVNRFGSGPESAVSNTVTPTTVPGIPTAIMVAAGDGSTTVSFGPPAFDGGSPILYYTATASPGGLSASGTSSAITVTGLTNGVAYTFSVSATNAAGLGLASAPSPEVVPSGADRPHPQPPQGPRRPPEPEAVMPSAPRPRPPGH